MSCVILKSRNGIRGSKYSSGTILVGREINLLLIFYEQENLNGAMSIERQTLGIEHNDSYLQFQLLRG
jgi:hypothetical protein